MAADLLRRPIEAAAGPGPVMGVVTLLGGVGGVVHAALRDRSGRLHAKGVRGLRLSLARIDAMTPPEFEVAVRDLLVRDGVPARHVGRRNDQAADVIAEDPRRGRIVLQCKHTTVGGGVGAPVMYQVKGTAGPAHGARHAVVVTNGNVTREARRWGDRHGVHWVDRARLRQWAEEGRSLPEVAGLPLGRRGRVGRGLRGPGTAGAP
ncbi:restriction endonuclease [Streptomyces calidiresistens]|uniref:Restriction endonuclease n=2 Tax=Streptomyces calidiresistens TaxID=1485586 RepID=A0A7W3T725_9ACTN|nr:restriction endonuclease [Streptomyces calidiresistens]